MTRTTPRLSALTKLVLAPFTFLHAAFSAVDWGRAFALPGYEAFVAKPVRVRTTTDPYYRGNAVQPANGYRTSSNLAPGRRSPTARTRS